MTGRVDFGARDKKAIAKAYGKGESLASLASQWGCGVASIRRVIEEEGVEIRGPGRKATAK